MTRALALAGLVLGVSALALQASLSIPASMAKGASLGEAVLLFISFLTIVSNTVLSLVYLSALTEFRALKTFRHPMVRGMMAALILLVFLYYHFVLGPTKSHAGLWYFANLLLHYVLPPLYLAFWLLAVEHRRLRWRDLPSLFLPPLVYLPYALAIGSLAGGYPYPILELNRLSFVEVMVNAAQVAAGLALLCALIVLVDKNLPRQT